MGQEGGRATDEADAASNSIETDSRTWREVCAGSWPKERSTAEDVETKIGGWQPGTPNGRLMARRSRPGERRRKDWRTGAMER